MNNFKELTYQNNIKYGKQFPRFKYELDTNFKINEEVYVAYGMEVFKTKIDGIVLTKNRVYDSDNKSEMTFSIIYITDIKNFDEEHVFLTSEDAQSYVEVKYPKSVWDGCNRVAGVVCDNEIKY